MVAVTQRLAFCPVLHLLVEEGGVAVESLVDLVLHGAVIETGVEGELGCGYLTESC